MRKSTNGAAAGCSVPSRTTAPTPKTIWSFISKDGGNAMGAVPAMNVGGKVVSTMPSSMPPMLRSRPRCLLSWLAEDDLGSFDDRYYLIADLQSQALHRLASNRRRERLLAADVDRDVGHHRAQIDRRD